MTSDDESRWELIERITALLEQSLTPTARVEHNVLLPVIGMPGDKRQCDVVITYGQPPRETVAIVEVQDRKSKIKINDFDGWTVKRGEVGASMLICVSERDFPISIKNRVLLKHGPTVKLLTLKELEEPTILKLKLFPEALFSSFTSRVVSVGIVKVSGSKYLSFGSEMRTEIHSSNDKVFEWDESHEYRSLNDLVSSELKNLDLTHKTANLQPDETIDIDINICHDESKKILWLHQAEQKFNVRELPVKVAVGIQESKIPIKCYSYKQEMIDNVIAWVASATGVINGESYGFQLVFHPGENGILRLVSVKQNGIEKAILHVFVGFPDEASAMDAFRSATSQENHDSALVLYNEGVVLYNLGNYEKALIAYDNSIKLDPKIALVWNNKGATLHSLGRNEESMVAYDRAIEINPNYCDPWYNKGNILREMDNHKEAISAYENAIKIDPKHTNAWSNKALSLLKLEEFEEAIIACDRAIDLDSKLLSAWGVKGLALSSLSRQECAIKAYEEVLKIDPEQAETWYNKGIALLMLGELEDAITTFDKATELKPEYEDAWNNKGIALSKLGKHEETVTAYENALKINPQLVETWYNKGVALHMQGKYDEAIQAYDKAIEINPQIMEAWNNKGIALKALGRTGQADAAFAKAKDLGYTY